MPTEHTRFWVMRDRDYLFIAVRCEDSAGADGIRAYSMQRDQDNGSDDIVRVVLDTFNRQNDGYYFGLTAGGGRHDGLVENREEANDQWDGLWFGRTSIDVGGWSAEFAIPVKSLSFDPGIQAWGFNLARMIRRKQESVFWNGVVRNKPITSLPLAGQLHGLAGFEQGRGVEVKPSASLTTRHDPSPGQKQTEFKPGLDLVWHVTPALAATLTINTDFADAEVDERQINLGRFPLFFPEKRGFFTQDASLFTFGGIGQDPLPFFSRRIGLGADGTAVDILAGLKLTGRAGPWTLGILDVELDDYEGLGRQNVFVARVARQVLEESSVGVIVTRGDPRGPGDASLAGVDFNYVNNRLPGDKALTVNTSVQATSSDAADGSGNVAVVKVDYPNEPFRFEGTFSRTSERYDPALGFVSRTGVAYLYLSNNYIMRPEAYGVRYVQFYVETEQTADLDFDLLDQAAYTGIYLENKHGDFSNVWFSPASETYDEPFEIRPGVLIPVGTHHWNMMQTQVGTARSRVVDVNLRWRHGGFLTGLSDDYRINLGWRPSNRLQFTLAQLWRDVRLPQGDFDVLSSSARVSYTFTPDLQVSLLGQYDNISESLGANFRIKWTHRPGTDFYFVINQGYDLSDDAFRPTAGELSVKGNWTWRY